MQGPYLEIHESGSVRQIPLGDDPLTIGRHSDNRVMLGDGMSSRFHCHISKSPAGTFVLRDLNSSNGTVVNGRVTKFVQLWPGDVVTIGQTRLIFFDPDAAPTARPKGESEIVELGRPTPGAVPPTPTSVPQSPQVQAPQPQPVQPQSPPLQPPAQKPPQPQEMEMLTDDDIVDDDEPIPLDIPGFDEAATALPVDLESLVDDFEPVAEIEAVDDLAVLDDVAPVDESMIVDDLIPVENGTPYADDVMPELIAAADPREVVESLVESLPNQPFGESDIALVSARGQLIHPAGAPSPRTNREAVDWLRLLLLLCSRSRATDVHFEPKGEDYLLRMRVDGTMVEVCRLSKALGIRLLTLVKVLSEVDIAQKSSAQEGHFNSRINRSGPGAPARIDYRVSFAPSVFGQKLVIRVLDTSYAPLTVEALQLPPWIRAQVQKVIRQDSGMVLVCGPTGSGKTTTLYALIRGSDITRRNVVTIEDPVEIQIEGVTQIPVDESHQKSFSDLLRSTLRQDPDVILIGEIRDAETARIAMQAAITGHLVFSTVHSQNTTGTIFRLLDLGAEPYLVSQALHLVLAQRLVRELCKYCRIAVAPTREQLREMGEAAAGVSRIYQPCGCIRCLNTGFSGRRAIFELLMATDELRDLITRTPTASQIHAALASTPFQRLQHSGFQLVAQGLASYDEVNRVVGRDSR
jgi:general secretion pathway protein E